MTILEKRIEQRCSGYVKRIMIALICSTLDNPAERNFMLGVYEKYNKLMYAIAGRTANVEDCEDIVQSAMIRLIKNCTTLMRLDEPALVKYISVTVHTTSIKHYTKKQSWQSKVISIDDDDLPDIPDIRPPIEEMLCSAESKEEFREAWRTLDDPERLILEQKYFLRLSDEEMSRIYDCKPASVRVKISRAKKDIYVVLALNSMVRSSESSTDVERALEQIGPKERDLLRSKLFDGKTDLELQKKYHCSHELIHKRLNRARRMLYELLCQKTC